MRQVPSELGDLAVCAMLGEEDCLELHVSVLDPD